MLFVFPDHPTLYAALLARCPDYEGRAYVGVTSTGVFATLPVGRANQSQKIVSFLEPQLTVLWWGFTAVGGVVL